jgi:hypothetical protein
MTLKNQRRAVARKLRKQLKLPFIMTKRIAKVIVDEGFWSLNWKLVEKGATVEALPYCQCCGPSSYEVTWEGQTFTYDVFRREVYNTVGEAKV